MAVDVTGEQMAILSARLRKITRKMTNTLLRSSRSGVINTARDFSCCLVTTGHELIEVAESLPIQVMAGPDLSSGCMVQRHPRLEPGDAFLHNSPYHGGGHAADHQILVPIFDDEGTHRLTALVKAHVADIGNSMPTTIFTNAQDVYQEGALIFPAVRVQRDYADVEDVIEMCRLRLRVPEAWYGDYLAMLGGARTAEREISALAAEVGWDTLDAHIARWFDYSEQLMGDAIAAMPAGTATAQLIHDALPGITEAVPLSVTVDCRPDEGRIHVDLTDNPDCLPCGLNLTEATALASARMGVYCGVPAAVPVNAGAFRRIDIALRENCCVGIPRHPASCSAATTGLVPRVAGMVQLAIAELGDGVGMAEHAPSGTGICPVFGADPRRGGRPFVDVLCVAWGGGGGGPQGDGLAGDTSNTAGVAYRHATETSELQLPLCVWVDRLEPDTAAPGRFRGTPSHRLEWEPVDVPLAVAWVGEGDEHPARGVRGGSPGASNDLSLHRADGTVERPGLSGFATLMPGDRYVSLSAGGGGYGPPAERDRAAIADDVAEGLLSPERAWEDYSWNADHSV